MSPWTFAPPSSSFEPLLHPCLLCSASFCRRSSFPGRRHPPPASPPSTRHLLLEPGSVSSSAVLPFARHGFPEHPPAVTSSSPWRAHRGAPDLYLSCAPALPKLLHFVLLLLLPIPELQLCFPLPPLLLSLRRPRLIVGSHDRPPTTPTDPLISFPHLCSSSPALRSPPILAGTRLSTIAVRRGPRLPMGSSLRAFPRHHDLLASTTSSL
jgi:hypothetical protein